ncbi:MAG: hypothetical protein ACE5JM_08345, partial [Armatimonadota bacterium]
MLIMLGLVALCLVAGPAHARLEIDPEHPYYFRDGDAPVYLLGASDRDAFFIWRNDKGFHWREYLQTLHDNGFNYVRQDVTAWQALDVPQGYPGQFSNPAWPFLRPGPGPAADGKPRFDLTRFDEPFFRSRIRPFIARAADLGIYVELTLFDGLSGRRWGWCLYDEGNHVNELAVEPRMQDTDAVLRNDALRAVQEAYVSKVLAETAGFGNVIYEICNESGGREWVRHFVEFIHDHPQHTSRLVSAGEQTSAFDPRTGPNDIIAKHRGGGGLYATDADVKRHHDALLSFRVGKPIIHNEYFLYANRSTDDPNFVRKMMWGDFTAGGHSNFYDFRYWRGTGRTVDDGDPSQQPPSEILDAGRHLRWLISRVPFWEMTPADACVSPPGPDTYAMALADEGRCYVVYLLGRQVAGVEMTVPEGDYRVRWYDPKSGAATEPRPARTAAGTLTLSLPGFDQDIVLWLEG